jgi:hypothetical protein
MDRAICNASCKIDLNQSQRPADVSSMFIPEVAFALITKKCSASHLSRNSVTRSAVTKQL